MGVRFPRWSRERRWLPHGNLTPGVVNGEMGRGQAADAAGSRSTGVSGVAASARLDRRAETAATVMTASAARVMPAPTMIGDA